MPRARRVSAHPAVVEAEKGQPLTAFFKVHDPRLGVLELKPQLGEDRRERRKRPFGFPAAVAERQQIVRVAHHHAAAALCRNPRQPARSRLYATASLAACGRTQPGSTRSTFPRRAAPLSGIWLCAAKRYRLRAAKG